MKRLPRPDDHSIVQKVRYMRDPIGYITECQNKLGDIFMLDLVKNGMVFACTPDQTKAIYMSTDDTLVAGEAKIKIFGKVLGQTSTLLLDGAEHLKRRRLMLPRFRGELMHTFGPVMVEACNRALDAMPRGREFSLHPHMHTIAFEVILRALFSATPSALMPNLATRLRDFANKAVTSRILMFPQLQKDLGPLSPWGKVVRIVAAAREALTSEIRRRRTSELKTTDIVGLLLDARHDDGTPLSDIEIRDEILTMVAAGHETTSMALTWLCYSVFSKPHVLKKLRAELSTRGSTEIDSLPYLDAVIKESMRFNSLIPNGSGRLAKKAFELDGYEVPEGAMVSVVFHALHRRPEIFDRPNDFLPERFIEKKYSPYESVSFGGGTRRCLGMPFAMYEMKLVLATLLDRFDLDVVQDKVRPMWRGMFLTPNKGLMVRVRPHSVSPGAAARSSISVSN